MNLSKVKSVTWMLEDKKWVVGKSGYCVPFADLQTMKSKLMNDLRTLKNEHPTSVSYDYIDQVEKNLENIYSLNKLARYIFYMHKKGCNHVPVKQVTYN